MMGIFLGSFKSLKINTKNAKMVQMVTKSRKNKVFLDFDFHCCR